MGDFNKLTIKLNNLYYQMVTKHTRGNKTLDKCYARIKNAFTQCKQRTQLGNSDHFIMHLIPSYVPLSKSKSVTVQKRDYSEENCENVLACFETTNWNALVCDEDSVDHQIEVITNYINFCTDICIPTKTFKK